MKVDLTEGEVRLPVRVTNGGEEYVLTRDISIACLEVADRLGLDWSGAEAILRGVADALHSQGVIIVDPEQGRAFVPVNVGGGVESENCD